VSKVFISYRRDDSAPTTGRIYDRLVAHFGRDSVFKDVDNIPYGENFPRYISGVLADCSVMLAIIGPNWIDAAAPSGQRRLDDLADFVRVEIEGALQRGVPVIPVLVQGAHIPAREQLPPGLQGLVDLNALAVRNDPDFNGDMYRLQTTLERWLPSMPAPQGRPNRPHGNPPDPGYSIIGPRQAQPIMPVTAPRELGVRYALVAGAIAGVLPGVLYFAADYTTDDGALYTLTVALSAGTIISAILAAGVAGFLCARRTALVRSGVLAGLSTGFVVWLGLMASILRSNVLFSLGYLSSAQLLSFATGLAAFLILSLVPSSVGGLIGRAVARRQETDVLMAAGR
jgi:hypothetical protein